MQQDAHHFEKLLRGYWQHTLSGHVSAAYFHCTDRKAFRAFFDGFTASLEEKPRVVRSECRAGHINDPYHPFLSFLKEYLAPLSVEEQNAFLEQAAVYQVQREIFSHYYTSGKARRSEEVITDELQYEKKCMLDGLRSQLAAVSADTALVFLIEDLQHAAAATLDLIRHLCSKQQDGRILLICTLRGVGGFDDQEQGNHWQDFIDYVQRETTLLELYAGEEYDTPGTETSLTLADGEMEQLLVRLQNAFLFLALEECREMGTKLLNTVMGGESGLQEGDYSALVRIVGDAYRYLRDYENALIYYNLLLSAAQDTNDRLQLVDAYRRISITHHRKANPEDALRFAHQSLKLALETGDETRIFYSYLNMFLVQERFTRESEEAQTDIFYNLEKLAQKLEMYNQLAHCYGIISTFAARDPKSREDIEEKLIYCDLMINIARRYGNENRLSAAYHNKGMLHSGMGQHDQALEFYRQGEQIRLRLGNKLEIIRIFNGLGYGYYMAEDYRNAHSYYMRSLKLLRDIRNYDEIALTLYNLAHVYLATFHNEHAISCLEHVLQLMHILRMKNLPFHTLQEIYTVTCIAYLKSGSLLDAYRYYKRCRVNQDSANPEEAYYKKLLQALLCTEEEQYPEAEKHFQQARSQVEDGSSNLRRLLPRFYYEYGLLYRKQGKKEQAAELFSQGSTVAGELGYGYHQQSLEAARDSEAEHARSFDYPEEEMELEPLIEIARQQATMTRLHRKVAEINFLNNLLNIIHRERDVEHFIQQSISLINANSLTELSFLLFRSGQEWKLVHSNLEPVDLDFSVEELVAKLGRNRQEKLLLNLHKDPRVRRIAPSLRSLIYLPLLREDQLSGCLLFASRNEGITLNEEDLRILALASKHFDLALQLKQANERLHRLATTDGLTGLYNRQELLKHLEAELLRLERINEPERAVCTLLFMDLDNFKYYNDTFGHDIGDLILVQFAEVLRATTRQIDVIARFGGDEFLALLVETAPLDGERVARRVHTRLEEEDYFRSQIEAQLGNKIRIPARSRFGCSIGLIACRPGNKLKSEELIKKADEALYKAKQAGKNCIKVL